MLKTDGLMIVGYYEGDKLMYAVKVRNGFVPRLRREVWERLKLLSESPMASLRQGCPKTVA